MASTQHPAPRSASLPSSPACSAPGNSSTLVFMSEEFRNFVQCVINGRCPGVFTTLAQDGMPHSRWMGTMYNQAFPIIYALTSPHSRKLDELRERSAATWLFANTELSMTLTFSGNAAQIFNPDTIQGIWAQIERKHHAYFLQEHHGFAVIETVVQQVGCCFPKSNFHTEISLEDFRSKMGLDLHVEM